MAAEALVGTYTGGVGLTMAKARSVPQGMGAVYVIFFVEWLILLLAAFYLVRAEQSLPRACQRIAAAWVAAWGGAGSGMRKVAWVCGGCSWDPRGQRGQHLSPLPFLPHCDTTPHHRSKWWPRARA